MRQIHLHVDTAGGRRAGLEQALRSAIRSGRLTPGAAVPSSRALAADLGFSRATVVAAYEQLVAEGYLTARQGAATTVTATPVGPATTTGAEPVGYSLADRAGPAAGPPVPTTFDFRPGEPDGSAFPRSAWQRSVRRVLQHAPDDVFGYGDPAGHPALRAALAEYLARTRAVSAPAGAVLVFPGFMAALGILCEVLRRRGLARVGVENPSLFATWDVMRLAGVTPVPIPVDDDGIDVAALEAADVEAVVVTPAHQYPLGATMSAERRAALIEWASTGDRWIVEDDYDGEFRYDRQPLGSLQGLAPERTVYAGTASKSMAAGLRLAWIVVPLALRDVTAGVKHLRSSCSNLDQLALTDFIERGALDRQVRTVGAEYRRRQRAVSERLRTEVGWLEVPEVRAGLHLTCRAERLDEHQLVDDAAAVEVGLMGLGPHWLGPPRASGLVIGYSRLPRHRFAEGLDRLVDVLARHRPSARAARAPESS